MLSCVENAAPFRELGNALRGHSPAERPPGGKITRVSRLMTLAVNFDQLIGIGVGADKAELSRLGYVSRARVAQIMNLLNVAPAIQEEILIMSRTEQGFDTITDRDLRPIAAKIDWEGQRNLWRQLQANHRSN